MTTDPTPATAMRSRLQADLRDAMKRRDQRETKLLRTLIAAIDNAEAVETPQSTSAAPPRLTGGSVHVVTGSDGPAEVARKLLSARDVDNALKAEQASRRDAASVLRNGGRSDDADALDADAAAIARYLHA